MSRLAAIIAFMAVVAAQRAAAEYIPPFDMTECVGRAKIIVRGKLDRAGNITVTTMHRGARPADGVIRLERGPDRYNRFNVPPENGPLDVLVFLGDDGRSGYRPVGDDAGMVRFHKDAVYAFLNDARRGLRESPEVTLHPDYKRESFLAAFKQTLDRDDERQRLLGKPRSPERTRDLLRFLVECPESARPFHFSRISISLAPVSADDGRTLLAALRESKKPVEQEITIDMIGVLHVQDAFDDMPTWLDRKHPAEVRRAAMRAMPRLDPQRSAEPLGRLLSINEPELDCLMSNLYSAGVDQGCPSRRVAGSLLGLGRDLRQLLFTEARDRWTYPSYNLLGLLAHYAHPQFISILFDWAMSDHPTANQALVTLQGLTGQKLGKDELIGWRDWLRANGPLLEAPYDLNADAGRSAWFRAYDKADAGAQKLLVRLWLYEPDIDESSLLRQATAKEQATGAKAVLAELWHRGRLSGPSRKEIVRRFLAVELVELPPVMKNDPAWRELQIVARPSFPFPEKAWIEPRSSIGVGREPQLDGSWGSRSLADIGKVAAGSMGGQYFGAPQARALLEIREKSRDGKVQWSHTWTLGPIRLREAAKPRERQ